MIKLLPLTKFDLDFLLEVRNDPSTRNNLENDSIFTLEQCLEWYKQKNPKWFIVENNNNKVGYFRTNGDQIGCDIHPNFRRNGFAKMAFQYYLSNVDSASLWVFEDNFAKKLYQDLGFKETGETKKIRDRNYVYMKWKRSK